MNITDTTSQDLESTNENENSLAELKEEGNNEEQAPKEDLSGLDKKELITRFEACLKQDDFNAVKMQVDEIRDAYNRKQKEELEMKKFMDPEEGPEEESKEDKRFRELSKIYFTHRDEFRKQREKSHKENLNTKKEIIARLKDLVHEEHPIGKSFELLQELQEKWRSTGNVPGSEGEELYKNYQHFSNMFFENIKLNKEFRELDQKKNLDLKTALVEKAEALESETSLRKSLDQLKVLQDKWKDIGQVAREHQEPLWQRFRAAANKVYDRRKEHVHKLEEQRKQNLEKKLALCVVLEGVASEDYAQHKDWQKANERVEEIFAQWQKIGQTPEEDQGNAWKRFKAARQKFLQAKDKFYGKQREEFKKHLQAKNDLIKRAEELAESNDWDKATNEIKRLQAEWKTSGHVPQKYADKVWKNFRAACDKFFERKAKHFEDSEKAFKEGLQHRDEYLNKVKEMAISAEDNIQDVIAKIKEEWEAMGELTGKLKERYHNLYTQAITKLISRSGADPAKVDKMRYDQLIQTQQGREELEKEKGGLRNKIKKLETEIHQLETNIGFFGKSKNASPLIQGYQDKLEDLRKELVSLNQKFKAIPSTLVAREKK